MKRPKVLMIASSGFIVRDYLLGNFLKELQSGADVVALSPQAHSPQFQSQMSALGIEVYPLLVPPIKGSWRRTRTWRHTVHISRMGNETWKIKQAHDSFTTPHRSVLAAAREGATRLLLQTAGANRLLSWLDRLERKFALNSEAAAYYFDLFRKLKIDLLFAPAASFQEQWLPIQVAQALQIKVVLGILSWDNLSSKSRLPLPAEKFLLWSQQMRKELLEYYPEIPDETLSIAGAPQYDYYFDTQLRESRESFFKRHGLDLDRPLVLYGGGPPAILPYEHRVVESVAEALSSSRFRQKPQLFVRLHPKDDGSAYSDLCQRYPDIKLFIPGKDYRGSLRDWIPSTRDIAELINTVTHADVHINYGSTMTLDAAVADKPVINPMYDFVPAGETKAIGYLTYDYTHYLPLLNSGGIAFAKTAHDLPELIHRYLENPSLHREGRKRMVELQCGHLDGKAGARMANEILNVLGESRHSEGPKQIQTHAVGA